MPELKDYLCYTLKLNCTLKVSHKTLGVQFKLCVAGGFF